MQTGITKTMKNDTPMVRFSWFFEVMLGPKSKKNNEKSVPKVIKNKTSFLKEFKSIFDRFGDQFWNQNRSKNAEKRCRKQERF